MALGVVGLLVHTLVMTNVQEQRRDMAVLRILGGQRNFLFSLVISEVLVIGAIGVGLGVVLGQLITRIIAVPLIQKQMTQQGITSPLTPQVTLSTLLPDHHHLPFQFSFQQRQTGPERPAYQGDARHQSGRGRQHPD